MPEIEAIVDGEGGKRVTITIAELNASLGEPPVDTGNDQNTFVIYNDKYKLTITIAE